MSLCDQAIKVNTVKNYDTNKEEDIAKNIGTDYTYKHKVLWINTSLVVILHFFGFWGLYLLMMGYYRWPTFFWIFFLSYAGTEGITLGAHRYYTHKAYKAKPGLRAVLILLQTLAGQFSMYTWVRDHRGHHRYADTDADIHNSKRGFFFAHIGWVICKKHPAIAKYCKSIDMSDIESDEMVRFQKKYYLPLYTVVAVIIPICVPVYLWNESWKYAILGCYFARYVFSVNCILLVNSLSHMYGTRPYDQNIQPVESWFVSMISLGEGWHNYHHTFPWDYKCAELSMHFNQSAILIRWFEKMGWAYDLKTASPETVHKRIMRTGDGSHYELGTDEARAAVTAFGPVHPMNPLYTTILPPPEISLKAGLPLFHENDTLTLNVRNKYNNNKPVM